MERVNGRRNRTPEHSRSSSENRSMLTTTRSRRSFLSLGLGALAVPSLLRASDSTSLATGKSVIFLFLQGGPSQFETFDPKPEAPDGIRTVTGIIPTKLPGVHFGDHLPKLAGLADKIGRAHV